MQDKDKYSVEMKDLYSKIWIKSLAKEVMPSGEFTPEEYKQFHKWVYQMKLPQDLIEFALEFSTFVNGKCGMQHYNKLIGRWKSSGITTKEEAMKDVMKWQQGQRYAEKGPEPVDFDGVHITDRKSIVAVTRCADGKPVIYVQGACKEFVIDDVTYEEAIARIEGRPVRTAVQKNAEKADQENESLSVYEKVKKTYEQLYNAPWQDREIDGGTAGQKKFANDIRTRARNFAMSLCRKALDMGTDITENTVLDNGLTPPAVIATSELVYEYYEGVSDFQQIINEKDHFGYNGIVGFARKWMDVKQNSGNKEEAADEV